MAKCNKHQEFVAFESISKRTIDIIGALILLILLLPLLLLVAVIIYVSMGSPILFKQVRPGYQGSPFEIIKFRTMRPPQSGEDLYRTDRQRLTKIGTFLRKTSIDELPELINVIKGEMSFVGPRPLLMEYLPRYTSKQMRRHDVRPGITGWAQINGRQHIAFSKRIELDIWYIENWSIWLDFRILVKTVAQVFFARGVESGQPLEEVDDLAMEPESNFREKGENH